MAPSGWIYVLRMPTQHPQRATGAISASFRLDFLCFGCPHSIRKEQPELLVPPSGWRLCASDAHIASAYVLQMPTQHPQRAIGAV